MIPPYDFHTKIHDIHPLENQGTFFLCTWNILALCPCSTSMLDLLDFLHIKV